MNARFFHAPIAHAAAVAALCAAASSAHAAHIPLGGATLDGAVVYDTSFAQDWSYEDAVTVDPAQILVTSTADTVGFTLSPNWTPFYTAGYQQGNNYGFGGGLLRLHGFTLTADANHVIDLQNATVTISGKVTLGDHASMSFTSGDGETRAFNAPGTRYGKTTFDFSFTMNAGQESLLSWSGYLPYAQGPEGTASMFSTVDLTVQRISYSAPLAAVPEASTAGMALVGLLAVASAAARRGRAPH